MGRRRGRHRQFVPSLVALPRLPCAAASASWSALFDTDASKVGQQVDGLIIHALDQLPEVLAHCKAELGLLAVPAEAAQKVADALVAAGIRGLLNFAPVVLRLPANVNLVSVADLTVQLEQLAFLVQMGSSNG